MIIYPQNTSEKLGFEQVKAATSRLCTSPLGVEDLEDLKPVGNVKLIRQELECTGEMMRLVSEGDALPLDNLHDVRQPVHESRVQRAVLDAGRMHKIKLFCTACRLLKQFLRARDAQFPHLAGLASGFIPLKELEQEIDRVVSEHGSVKDGASAELKQIRKSLASRKNELRAAVDKMIRRAMKDGFLAESEPTIRNGRMVLPVKAEHKRKLNGFVQDVSATGQTVYIEPAEALHINNDIRELEQREKREIERLLMQLTARIGRDRDHIMQNAMVGGRIDALHAKAVFCSKMDGIIPELNEKGNVRLLKARNPVLLLKNSSLPKDRRESVVPLTLEMEKPERGLIITGPNAGGKSVALKTVGICMMMIQSGYAIPASEESSLPVFDGVFLDMGDEQSIDNDLSTFSSRLTWMRDTLQKCGPDSLVLVDEAGTGTDPDEGVALFQAFLEEISEIGAHIIATTHHGNLKVFAHEHPNFVNGSMEFDQKGLSPTYQFRKGLPGSSYAFEISQRIGVDDRLLDRARTLVGSSKNKLESLILEMESKTQQADHIRMELAKERAAGEKMRKEFEQRLGTIKSERDKLREKALNEAKEIMQGANARIEEAIRRIYESKGDKEAIKKIREEVDAFKSDVDKGLRETAERRKNKTRDSKEPPQVGDHVKLLDSRSSGELLEVSGKQAIVQVNGLRLKTKYKNLVKTNQPPKEIAGFTVKRIPGEDLPKPVSPTLDLRGYRGEEAVREFTYYLDRAVASRMNQVEIIHGKGDGILKKLIHEELRRRKDIKSFDLAPWEQGGPGCTIVEI